tara:strand:- start:255 stop:830 length:576 start_codon:yes stop_codon:yes gene_type:complete
MAEYNDWEPVLDPVNGVMQQEPRVFGHDAVAISAGALNGGFTITNGGSGFDSSDVGDTVAQSGASSPSGGSGATFNITQVTGDAVTGVELTSSATGGTGYVAGMVITLAAAASGGSGCQVTVSSRGADIPNTGKRGAVVYNGKSSAQDITIVTEAGNQVEFKSCQPGTVVGHKAPMLAKKLVAGTDCVAIY